MVTVSDSEVVKICNDKIQTGIFAKDIGLNSLFTTINLEEVIQQVEDGNIDFPLFIKPRWGMGSIAMQEAKTIDELKILFKKVKRDLEDSYLKHYPFIDPEASVIIQEKAQGQEYGLDVVNDLKGNYVTTFIKRKLAMRSGETDGAVIEELSELKKLSKKLVIPLVILVTWMPMYFGMGIMLLF